MGRTGQAARDIGWADIERQIRDLTKRDTEGTERRTRAALRDIGEQLGRVGAEVHRPSRVEG